MLQAVKKMAPDLLPFVSSTYYAPSLLYLGDNTLESAEGVQQGDSLGPQLFCLSTHHLTIQLASDFKLFTCMMGHWGVIVRMPSETSGIFKQLLEISVSNLTGANQRLLAMIPPH